MFKFNFSKIKDFFIGARKQTVGLKAALVAQLSQQVYDDWSDIATKNLSKSKAAIYINGLKIVPKGTSASSITLTGKIPVQIEEGEPPFDMKPGFARSSKVKQGKKGGWYLTIPISKNATSIPVGVYIALLRGKTPNIRSVRAGVSSLETMKSFPEYTSEASIYKNIKFALGKGGVSATTFRRVSNKSATNSWIRKGVPGVKLANQIADKYSSHLNIKIIVEDYINNI